MIDKAMKGLHETITNVISEDKFNLPISQLTKIAEKRFFSSYKCTTEQENQIKKQLESELFGYGPLTDLMAEQSISEIMVNNFDKIYYEKDGVIHKTNRSFLSKDTFLNLIERIVSLNGYRLDESLPYVDTMLPDGSRLNAIVPPVALTGPHLTIRKFNNKKYSIEGLVKTGFIEEKIVTYLKQLVLTEQNILVSGNTGSGKTTLLNALSEFIPNSKRIITIEDTAELELRKDHLINLLSKKNNIEGRGEISIRELLKNALRMRPDRIIIGECRGSETLDMLLAMNTGHMGSMSTIHSNSAKEALKRVESIILLSNHLNPQGIKEQISSSIDYVIHTKRGTTGKRVLSEILEVAGLEGNNITCTYIYKNNTFSPELSTKNPLNSLC